MKPGVRLRDVVNPFRDQPHPMQVAIAFVGLVLIGVAVCTLLPAAANREPGLARIAFGGVSLPGTFAPPPDPPASSGGLLTGAPLPPSLTIPPSMAPGRAAALPGRDTPAAQVVAFALAQVGKPYRFGAGGPEAFDCSGLTRAAYLTVGIDLPHRARWQVAFGQPVRERDGPTQPGDLVFTRGGRPAHDYGHVGLAVSADEWVVAPAPGRVVERAPIPFDSVQAVRRIVG